ncbi:thermonuclease family protein [Candidatus Gottesmanbacteria bacterium]|nr:thermonuclease family protein [Candidatus Gottesmanbacteria bacterium]
MKSKPSAQNKKSGKNKYVLVPLALLLSLSSFFAGTKYESEIKDAIENQPVINQQQIIEFPTEAKIKRVIDGDTLELQNGQIVRLVGVNTPDHGQPYDEESTEFTKKLVEEKKVNIEYDEYKSDRFGRILAYVVINNKNLSIELAKRGLAKVTIYEKRKPLIYQEQLLNAEKEAKLKKLGIWKAGDK